MDTSDCHTFSEDPCNCDSCWPDMKRYLTLEQSKEMTFIFKDFEQIIPDDILAEIQNTAISPEDMRKMCQEWIITND